MTASSASCRTSTPATSGNAPGMSEPHHTRRGSVPQTEMACTEGHLLPAFRLAAIDWQATFAAMVFKAGADCQA